MESGPGSRMATGSPGQLPSTCHVDSSTYPSIETVGSISTASEHGMRTFREDTAP